MNFRLLAASAALWSALFLPVLSSSRRVSAQPTTSVDSTSEHPFLHPLFTDDAVLQRNRIVPIWGWVAPGAVVTVKLDQQNKTTRADATGRWMTSVGPLPAGGPHTLTVSSDAQTVVRQGILFGDVWLCSGQSNMELGIGNVNNAQQEIATANYSQIRLYTVPKSTAASPRNSFNGNWLVCTPENIAKSGTWNGFSAVGYFFGRKLYQELKVPIGLIASSWGGTEAESWVSASALGTLPDFRGQIASVQRAATDTRTPEQQRRDWEAQNDVGIKENWADPATPVKNWSVLPVPATWQSLDVEGLNEFAGLAWYRRDIIVPADWAGHDLTLHVGAIDDADTTYWNGVAVGNTSGWDTQREYKIPANQVKVGRNVIAIRVLNNDGDGGVRGPADRLNLMLDANNTLPLAGDWNFKLSTPAAQMTSQPVLLDGSNPHLVTVLYNAMIAPLVPYSLKGVIWYQGENNAGRGEQYGRLLPTLIRDWRQHFATPMSFYIVQLAGYMAPDREPRNDDWPQIRAAQLRTAQTVEHTGIAVTTDIGEQGDIHPKNKQDVGLRLALNALAKDYGRKVEYSGPSLRSARPNGSSLILTFDHVEEGLTLKGEADHVFAVAGSDRNWFWATPQIQGNRVILTSPMVPAPVAVRFGWSNLPTGFLYNGANLPAAPFQTSP